MMTDTIYSSILDLGLIAIGLGADRQIKESLQPIDTGDLRRTVNGVLVSLADPAFKKYKLSVSCDDMLPPAFGSIWRGQQLTVSPVSEIADVVAVGGTSRTLERDPVAGSIRCVDIDGGTHAFTVAGRVVTLSSAATKPTRIFYRPTLTMMVSQHSVDHDEAAASVSWSLDLEEI